MADLVVENLGVRLVDAEILKNVSLSIPAGKVAALLGPSGSGKTTLLRAVAGLETPHAGSIRVGHSVLFDAAGRIDVAAEKRGLGLVFQSYALWPHRSVFDNVAYGLVLRGVNREDIRRRVDKALAQIGLAPLAARYPHQLSGGQQQRVALARALVYEPSVILLDEPMSNLDAKLREEARTWLRALIVDAHLCALFVTHDQVEAMAIADRISLLNEGVIEQEGAPTELYNEPATLFAAEFMGSNNRLSGKVIERQGEHATIDVAGHRLAGVARSNVAVGASATGVVRNERVRIANSPGPNRIAMSIAAQMYIGERWEIVFTSEGATIRAYSASELLTGAHYIELPETALWIF